MSRDMLSQDEIDALLRANNLSNEDDAAGEKDVSQYLSAFEQDALGEIGNITFGSAATALSTLLNQKVDITTPSVSIVTKEELGQNFPRPHVAIHVEYTDGFSGINLLIIRVEDAAVIADLMMGGTGHPESTEMTELQLSAVQEAMNQMMGSAATSMSTIFNKLVNISPPGVDLLDFSGDSQDSSYFSITDTFVKVSFRLKVGEHGELIDSSIMQLLPVSFAKQMIEMLMGTNESSMQETAATAAATPAATPAPEHAVAAPQQPPVHTPSPMPEAPTYGYGYAPVGSPQGVPPHAPYPPYPYPPSYHQPAPGLAPQQLNGHQANVKPAEFSPFMPGRLSTGEEQNLGLLLDIPLQVTVELGRTKKLIKEILEMTAGSIIQLDKLAGEPVDILVNNKLVAKGEVVVIDENFGVRVTDIISPIERVQKLQ